MIQSDRRKYPRLNPEGMKASVVLTPYEGNATVIEGDVVDISFTGIKIRLKAPLTGNLEGLIRIGLNLPDTRIPFYINGILKHQATPTELGLHYIDSSNVIDLDKFILECVKHVKT
jgi:PilZ domain